VIVYCRKGNYDSAGEYKGIRRIMLPHLNFKITDTYSHSFLAMCHVLTQKADVVLAFNPAISTLCTIPRLFGRKVALNPDGFDWRRKKWGWFARRFIYVSAYIAAKVCNKLIIDAVSVKNYYQEVFKCDPVYVPNGANIETPDAEESASAAEILREYGLEKDGYFLFLSRHEPENSCEYIIEAYEGLETDKKLFFAGGISYKSPYAESLKGTKDERIIFPGAIYDPLRVKLLHHNCYALVHGNQPGGTSLGLLKALGFGTCVMTVNTPDNAYAAAGDAALLYDLSSEDIREKMRYLLEHPERVEHYRRRAVERIREEYIWDKVADQYERAFASLVGEEVGN
jgi:glycosyltransferase involved in cell wall biosynthesis